MDFNNIKVFYLRETHETENQAFNSFDWTVFDAVTLSHTVILFQI